MTSADGSRTNPVLEPSRAESEHRPSLGAHRLLGQGRGSALIRPSGEIDWWCPNQLHATPLLWSLLDADGGSAHWLDVEIATWDAAPAGATAHTTLRHGGGVRETGTGAAGWPLDTWDGLVERNGTTMLVRLLRSRADTYTVTHRLTAGGFDAARQSFTHCTATSVASVVAVEPTSELLRIVGGNAHRLGSWVLDTDVVARPDTWSGLAIVVGALTNRDLTEAHLEALLRDAERLDREAVRHTFVPHRHPSRALDALKVLRSLTDPTSGAPAAAPTTSLPEAPGGTRQFDYRFSWLRDSANAVATASLLGHMTAASNYLHCVSKLLDTQGEQLHPLGTTDGYPVPEEREIDGVGGWAGSKPIRVGNAAGGQRQIDSVTCVVEAVGVYVSCGGRMTRETWSIVARMAALLVDAPVGDSNGVWELRDPQSLVSEELARWAGLDRATRLRRRYRPWQRRVGWTDAIRLARARVEAALDEKTGLFPQAFGGDPTVTDATSLLAAINGFFERDDPRLKRLVHATISALGEGDFLRRYPPADDGFIGREACFVPASWWAVSALAIIGELAAAERRADGMCAQLPPLQPEEWDVERNEALGNTPLLWSHTEAARALYTLHTERIRHRFGSAGLRLWCMSRYVRVRVRRDGP